MNKKKKYIAVFMLKEQESYTIQKRKKFNPLDKQKIRFRNKTYLYNIAIPTYSKGLKQYFLFDINSTTGHLLFIKNKESLITPEIIDDICSKHIIRDLTSNLTNQAFKMNLMMIFLGLVIGGLIGWIAGGYT